MSVLSPPQKLALECALAYGSWSDLDLTHENCLKANSTLRTVWTFAYDTDIECEGKIYLLADVLNSKIFRAALADAVAVPHQISAEVSPVERVGDECFLWVAMNRIEHACEDCGAPVENGHMTCLCWADEEDLKRMDRDLVLHR